MWVIALLYCSTLGNALVTLFQLFTLDHWYDILRDLIKVVDSITVKIYIILWICIGAFIFRNIFAGIMGECIFNCNRDVSWQKISESFLVTHRPKQISSNKECMVLKSEAFFCSNEFSEHPQWLQPASQTTDWSTGGRADEGSFGRRAGTSGQIAF